MTVRSGRIAAFRQRGGLLRLGCPIATILAVEATVVAAPATARDKPRKCEFYVSSTGSDSNSGSQSSPLRTIGAASQLVQPGTTVHVAPGTYAGGFMTTTSGTSSAPITYISDVPYGAKIVGAGNASVSNAAGWENRGDYVNVTGFEIDGSGSQATAWAFGFYNGGSHVTFQGNEVHDVMTDPAAYVKLTAHDNGGAGVMMDNYYGGSDGKVLANVVRNIGPTGWRSYLVHGIYQTETGSVRYNTIHDVVGSGIHLWHAAHHISITNNTVDGAAGGAGIIVGSGDSGSSSTTGDYVVVAANIVVNSAASIQEVGATGLHNRYTDNLVYNNMDARILLQNGLLSDRTMTADPLFVDQVNHDYRLRAGSPAISMIGTLGAFGREGPAGGMPSEMHRRDRQMACQ